MRWAVLVVLLVRAAVAQPVEPTPPVDRRVLLQVSLASNRHEFHMGEIIPIKLSYSSHVKNRYQLNEAQYDRSGRMEYERFSVTPAKGAVDPIPADALSMVAGGMTNFMYLTPKRWRIQLNLNEWLRFTAPGEYKLTVSSKRVEVKDPSSPFGTSLITARSNEITLKILPLDRDWQKRTYDEAVATSKASASVKAQEVDEPSVQRAWDTLRFLGTAEAARELAKRLHGESPGSHDFICYMGLVCSPERAVARDALKEALADPDHPINDTLLDALRMVESEHHATDPYCEEEQRKREEGQRKVMEELIAVLPNKRGQALPISLITAVDEAWNSKTLPQQTVDKLVGQLIAIFDQLPPHEQCNLLTYRWDKFGNPALLPIVRRYAQVSRDSLEGRGANTWDSWQLIASAIKHWFELDPGGARPFIIKEITQPAPSFDATVLGILPDQTLPEIDSPLAEHFIAGDDNDAFVGTSNVASLIARYATPAILAQIVKELDAHIGQWPCAIQTPILAYVLRADPQAARSRIERALAARGGDLTGCYRNLFEEVAAIHYDPVLEEVGVHALDDRDTEVAMSAANMLGKFGSAAVESALSRRYAGWSQHWVGRESELNLTLADDGEGRSNQLGLGKLLMQALATGQGWFTDRSKLKRLAEVSKVRSIQTELDRYLKTWDKQPLAIDVSAFPILFSAHVAQYHFDSINALERKLAQFPSGTKFALSTTPSDSTSDKQCVAEVRAFLTSHGMSIAEQKSAR